MRLDHTTCYRAVQGRDRRFDGVFYTAVRTTGIYCRPSCPATTPRPGNVEFFPTAAAAQGAGFRACRRCLPDATPGSPEWDIDADVAARAMRLVADGVVDREGVDGLAGRLGYSVRQLHRVLVQQYGAGPLALARSRRAQTARVLIETTPMTFADVAFAAGFTSVRQFNDTIREVYAATPSELRSRGRSSRATGTGGVIRTRVAVREPFDGPRLLDFLAARAVPGVEHAAEGSYERSLRLPHGAGVVRVELGDRPAGVVLCGFRLADSRDLPAALERTRRLLDADCDPVAVVAGLAEDPLLAPVLALRPGLRVPGHVDGEELAVRAVLGQQVGVDHARTLAARLVAEHGEPLGLEAAAVDRLFPAAAVLAEVDVQTLPMPRSRGRALTGVCAAVRDGRVALDRSMDRREATAALRSVTGIGPWTAAYVAMRALGDPDAFLAGDVGVRHGAARLGIDTPEARSEQWRPWRSYAVLHLWAAAGEQRDQHDREA